MTNRIDIEESIDNGIERILELIAVWLSEGSGWVLESVELRIINIVSYFPLRGTYIELPKELRNPMKGLINPKNEDSSVVIETIGAPTHNHTKMRKNLSLKYMI